MRSLFGDFVRDVRSAALRIGIQPSTLVQRGGCGGQDWERWTTEPKSSPTLRVADRVRGQIKKELPDFEFSDQADNFPEGAEQ